MRRAAVSNLPGSSQPRSQRARPALLRPLCRDIEDLHLRTQMLHAVRVAVAQHQRRSGQPFAPGPSLVRILQEALCRPWWAFPTFATRALLLPLLWCRRMQRVLQWVCRSGGSLSAGALPLRGGKMCHWAVHRRLPQRNRVQGSRGQRARQVSQQTAGQADAHSATGDHTGSARTERPDRAGHSQYEVAVSDKPLC